jgi:dipeptide transport system substrate-binding protein
MSSKNKNLWAIAVVSIVIFIVGVQTTTAKNIKDFNYCAEANPVTFNAQLATDGATFNASSRPLYNRLVGVEVGTTRVGPSLAKSWRVSDNGREFIFYLRDGVVFHTTDYFKPTRNLNAEDVLFTFSRMRDRKHPYHMVGGGKYPSFLAQQMGEIIERIEIVDPMTIKFVLHRPEAPFLANLAMDFASILSAEYGAKLLKDKTPELIDQKPIGTGPFVFVSYKKGQAIHYRANEKYFEGPPKVEKLHFSIVENSGARLLKLKSGECDLMPEPSPESIEDIRQDPNLKILQQPGLNIAYMAMHTAMQPFDDVLVRKAIHHALNREKYIQVVYLGNAQVAKNPIPPTMWSYNRKIQDYDYSVTKAKALLAKSKSPQGFATDLWYADISRPYNPDSRKMAELIAEDLRAIGIQVTLRSLGWQQFLKRSRKGELPMSIQGWTGDNGDPDNFLNNLRSCQSREGGNNRAFWCHKRFSFLVDRARVTTNIRVRTKYYEEAQQIFKEEAPWVTLAHSIVFKVARKNLQGYRISPFGVIEFHKVSVQ